MASKPFSARSTILVIAIMLFIVQISTAQYSRRRSDGENSWEIGFSGGVSKFLTSINPNSGAPYKKFNYWNADYNTAITLSVIRNFSPKFSAEFEFLTTKLSGTWNKNNPYGIPYPATAQNLPGPFKTGINQFALIFVPNLNKIFAPNSSNDKWYLFVKGGFGAAILKEYNGLFPYTPGNTFKYTIVYGGGLSYTINEKIKLKLGSTWYRVETDRLDGLHTSKPGVAITGDASFYYNVKERYIYPYIGLTYGFGQTTSKAHFMQRRNSMSLWFKSSAHKYKKRR
jgi:hypothetical protein